MTESYQRSNVKNSLIVKQLVKQAPTFKTLLQTILVELWVNNIPFSILNSLKLTFSTTVSGTT